MSEAPAGNCRGFGDEDDIRRYACCRGGSAAGISVYIEVNLSAFPSAFGRARTQLSYRGEPLLNEASGRALWGASIPVIPVTVMGHRKETYTTSSRQQEGTG